MKIPRDPPLYEKLIGWIFHPTITSTYKTQGTIPGLVQFLARQKKVKPKPPITRLTYYNRFQTVKTRNDTFTVKLPFVAFL